MTNTTNQIPAVHRLPDQGIYCGSPEAAENVAEAMREASGQAPTMPKPASEKPIGQIIAALDSGSDACRDVANEWPVKSEHAIAADEAAGKLIAAYKLAEGVDSDLIAIANDLDASSRRPTPPGEDCFYDNGFLKAAMRLAAKAILRMTTEAKSSN